MQRGSQFRQFGRFLYTQNPFYLISCGLILYGVHLAIPQRISLESRSWMLAGAMAAYTLLMAGTAIAVIRIGKVWEDARSILMIVIIGLLGLSVSFDQLCISNWKLALVLLGACGLFALIVSELVIHSCGIQLPGWYRGAYYLMLAAFFGVPIMCGYAVEHEWTALKNWAAPIFSTLAAAGLLLMTPAVRHGEHAVVANGTPWRWPLFPLSMFVVLVVVAIIRSHAIWMSFSTLRGPIVLEPFLIVPFGFAIACLLIEYDRRNGSGAITTCCMLSLPLLGLAGTSRNGLTHLPIGEDIALWSGSAMTLVLAIVILFYIYVWVREGKFAEYFVIGGLAAMALFVPMPEFLTGMGMQNWMCGALSAAFCLGICLTGPQRDWRWFLLCCIASMTMCQAGFANGPNSYPLLAAAVNMLAGTLAIGAVFNTEFAAMLRCLAAIMLGLAAVVLIAVQAHSGQMTALAVSAALAFVPIGYLLIVRRSGWLYVAMWNAVSLTAAVMLVNRDAWSSLRVDFDQLLLPTGVVCFGVALAITSAKTGVHQRIRERLKFLFPRLNFVGGL